MSHDVSAHAPGTHAHDDGHGSGHPHINYFAIFMALCVCTGLSVVFDALPATKPVIAVLVLAVAVAKAQFVMRYFMHLQFEGLWKYVLLLPTAILACGLPLALAPDIAMHYYTTDADGPAAPGEGGEGSDHAAEGEAHPEH